jgi:hypothetical protein
MRSLTSVYVLRFDHTGARKQTNTSLSSNIQMLAADFYMYNVLTCCVLCL